MFDGVLARGRVAEALDSFYATGDARLLDAYSATCLARV